MLIIGLFGALARTSSGRLYDYTEDATYCFVYGGVFQILAAILYSNKLIIQRIRTKHKVVINHKYKK